jgi:hypothetical protein
MSKISLNFKNNSGVWDNLSGAGVGKNFIMELEWS